MDSGTKINHRTRRNLRLSQELCAAVDAACERRAGSISFNTWIIEAVQEKLARERGNDNRIAATAGRKRNA